MLAVRYYLFCSLLISVLGAIPQSGHGQTFMGQGGVIDGQGAPLEVILDIKSPFTNTLSTFYGLQQVCLNISHSRCGDLDITLISPAGHRLELITGVGGGGQNFQTTCLRDDALLPITAGIAPFHGSFRPMGLLGDANAMVSGSGDWLLRVVDTDPSAGFGELLNWSLTFGPAVPGPLVLESSDLPIVLIDTDDLTIPNDKVPAQMAIIDTPGQANRPEHEPNIYNGLIDIKRRGNFSNSLPQRPYSVDTRNATGGNLNVPLFGMAPENDWIMLAGYNDKSLMRNALAFRLFRDMGHWAPNTRLCEVMVNGRYDGIYIFTERIKRDPGRVAISKLYPFQVSGDNVTGSYIFGVDYFNDSNSWRSKYSPLDHPTRDVHFVYRYPKPDVISEPQKDYLQDYVASFEKALYGAQFSDPEHGYRAWIDTRSFIDYFILNELARNADGFKKSRYFHKDRNSVGGLLKAGPVWDFDWAWMNIPGCPNYGATDGSGWVYRINDCETDVNSPGWMVRLLQDPAFADELYDRYNELRGTILNTDHIFSYIDSVGTLVEDAQQRHFTRWPILGQVSGTPEVAPLSNTYAEELQRLKDWITLRLDWLDRNIPTHRNAVKFEFFPNPAEADVTIKSLSPMAYVRVFDTTGRVVLETQPHHAFDIRISVEGLVRGTYLLQVIEPSGAGSTQRFIRN